ncbi:unnamed protein product [Vitrella brassicaformis CCMP3155]|uniref:Protein kinase domain-containing protein n=1 Tax=Vitrella brassicaformis (strain CCMP3155) TaxID=1169540 RepID=A0A0G4GPI2_VITBC|nr:unnamed protein product [Vitrella brassicaformis CCMP3155]|eukprot:CEM32088.1 unnamed protein product [Vitrella brassicaformis CCMP3155]
MTDGSSPGKEALNGATRGGSGAPAAHPPLSLPHNDPHIDDNYKAQPTSDLPMGPQGGQSKASSGQHDAADAKQLDGQATRSVVERVLEVLVREAVRRMHNTEEASDGQEGAAGAKQLDGEAAKVEASGGVMERVLLALVREAVRRIHSTQGSHQAAIPTPKKHQLKRSRSFAGHPSLEDSDTAPLLRRVKSSPDLAASLLQNQDQQASGVAQQQTAMALGAAAAAGDGDGAGGADEQQGGGEGVGGATDKQKQQEGDGKVDDRVQQEPSPFFLFWEANPRLNLLCMPLRVGARKEYELQSMTSVHQLTAQATVVSWEEGQDARKLICQMQRVLPSPVRDFGKKGTSSAKDSSAKKGGGGGSSAAGGKGAGSSGGAGRGATGASASAASGGDSPSTASSDSPPPPPSPPQEYGPKTLFNALECHPLGSLARQNFVYQYLKASAKLPICPEPVHYETQVVQQGAIKDGDFGSAPVDFYVNEQLDCDLESVMRYARQWAAGQTEGQEGDDWRPAKLILELSIEAVPSLRELHSHGLVHEHVKPRNMMVKYGHGKRVYLVDLKQCRPVRSKPGDDDETSRRNRRGDDLEGLCYSMLCLLKGDESLPWVDNPTLPASSNNLSLADFKTVADFKRYTNVDQLCEGLPGSVCEFVKEVLGYGRLQLPRYDHLMDLLRTAIDQLPASEHLRRLPFLDEALTPPGCRIARHFTDQHNLRRLKKLTSPPGAFAETDLTPPPPTPPLPPHTPPPTPPVANRRMQQIPMPFGVQQQQQQQPPIQRIRMPVAQFAMHMAQVHVPQVHVPQVHMPQGHVPLLMPQGPPVQHHPSAPPMRMQQPLHRPPPQPGRRAANRRVPSIQSRIDFTLAQPFLHDFLQASTGPPPCHRVPRSRVWLPSEMTMVGEFLLWATQPPAYRLIKRAAKGDQGGGELPTVTLSTLPENCLCGVTDFMTTLEIIGRVGLWASAFRSLVIRPEFHTRLTIAGEPQWHRFDLSVSSLWAPRMTLISTADIKPPPPRQPDKARIIVQKQPWRRRCVREIGSSMSPSPPFDSAPDSAMCVPFAYALSSILTGAIRPPFIPPTLPAVKHYADPPSIFSAKSPLLHKAHTTGGTRTVLHPRSPSLQPFAVNGVVRVLEASHSTLAELRVREGRVDLPEVPAAYGFKPPRPCGIDRPDDAMLEFPKLTTVVVPSDKANLSGFTKVAYVCRWSLPNLTSLTVTGGCRPHLSRSVNASTHYAGGHHTDVGHEDASRILESSTAEEINREKFRGETLGVYVGAWMNKSDKMESVEVTDMPVDVLKAALSILSDGGLPHLNRLTDTSGPDATDQTLRQLRALLHKKGAPLADLIAVRQMADGSSGDDGAQDKKDTDGVCWVTDRQPEGRDGIADKRGREG